MAGYDRLDAWTSRLRNQNGVSLSNGAVKPSAPSKSSGFLPRNGDNGGHVRDQDGPSEVISDDEDMRSARSDPLTEGEYGEGGCVQEATEWSEVVAAARGISSGSNSARDRAGGGGGDDRGVLARSSSTPPPSSKKLHSLHPNYHKSSSLFFPATSSHLQHKGGRRPRNGNSNDYDDDSSSQSATPPYYRRPGEDRMDILRDPWDTVVDGHGNTHLPPTLEQEEEDSDRDCPELGPDDEPIGATSLHNDTVVGSEGTALDSPKDMMAEVEDGPRRNYIVAATDEDNVELEHHNACLGQRIRELERELEYKTSTTGQEVASLNARIQDLRKSLAENMSAAAEEFATLTKRLKDKEGEFSTKEAEMKKLLQKEAEAKQQLQHRLEVVEEQQRREKMVLEEQRIVREAQQRQQFLLASTTVRASVALESTVAALVSSSGLVMDNNHMPLSSSIDTTDRNAVPLTTGNDSVLLQPPSMENDDRTPAPSKVDNDHVLLSSTPLDNDNREAEASTVGDGTRVRKLGRTQSMPVPGRGDVVTGLQHPHDDGGKENEKGELRTKSKPDSPPLASAEAPRSSSEQPPSAQRAASQRSSVSFDGGSAQDTGNVDVKKARRSTLDRMTGGYFRLSLNAGRWKRFPKLQPVNRSPPPTKDIEHDAGEGEKTADSPSLDSKNISPSSAASAEYSTHAPTASPSTSPSSTPDSSSPTTKSPQSTPSSNNNGNVNDNNNGNNEQPGLKKPPSFSSPLPTCSGLSSSSVSRHGRSASLSAVPIGPEGHLPSSSFGDPHAGAIGPAALSAMIPADSATNVLVKRGETSGNDLAAERRRFSADSGDSCPAGTRTLGTSSALHFSAATTTTTTTMTTTTVMNSQNRSSTAAVLLSEDVAAMALAKEAERRATEREKMASAAVAAAVAAEGEARMRNLEMQALLESAQAKIAEVTEIAERAVREAATADARASAREAAAEKARVDAALAQQTASAEAAKAHGLAESAQAKADRVERQLAEARTALTLQTSRNSPHAQQASTEEDPEVHKRLAWEQHHAHTAMMMANAMSISATSRVRGKFVSAGGCA